MLLDDSRQTVMRWNFHRGWPCKLTGPALKAKGNEIAIEDLGTAMKVSKSSKPVVAQTTSDKVRTNHHGSA